MPVIHIRSEDEYDAILKKSQDKLVVVDFTAKWCGPCQRIGPIFDKLSDTYRNSTFLKVDVDENSEVAQNNGVRAMPTFLFIKKGSEVDRLEGGDPETLEEKIKQHGVGSSSSLNSFGGEGHRLGADGSGSSATSSTSSNANVTADVDKAQESLKVDHQKPTTKINVRLADGTRFTVTLNLSHSVGKIREFICTARPDQGSKTFVLVTPFPTKEISDETQSIEEAKLLNAVVTQKMK